MKTRKKTAKRTKSSTPTPRHADPRVHEIMAVFSRTVGSPAFDNSMPSLLMHELCGTQPDWFTDWRTESVRAVLLANCTAAPEHQLLKMLTCARKHLAWLAEFEDDPTGEVRGYSLVTGEKRERKAAA